MAWGGVCLYITVVRTTRENFILANQFLNTGPSKYLWGYMGIGIGEYIQGVRAPLYLRALPTRTAPIDYSQQTL